MLKIFIESGSLVAEIKFPFAVLVISESMIPLLVAALADGPAHPAL